MWGVGAGGVDRALAPTADLVLIISHRDGENLQISHNSAYGYYECKCMCMMLHV